MYDQCDIGKRQTEESGCFKRKEHAGSADRVWNGNLLKEAVRETFEHRETGFDDIFAFDSGFITSEIHQGRWKAFLKKKKALVNAELEEMILMIKALLIPIVDSIESNTDYSASWDPVAHTWR